MNPKWRAALVAAVLVGLIAGYVGAKMATRPATEEPSAFARAVDLTPLSGVAVHYNGRLKSFHSFAHAMMRFVSGPESVNGQDAPFTYLDMALRAERYVDEEAIYVGKKPVRAMLATRLEGAGKMTPKESERFMRLGLASVRQLRQPESVELIERLGRDAMRGAKAADQIQGALTVSSPGFLFDALRVIPPRGAVDGGAWLPITALGDSIARDQGELMAMSEEGAGDPALLDELRTRALWSSAAREAWGRLATAWRAEDAEGVNAAARELGAALPRVNAAQYPPLDRLAWEGRYFELGKLTWVWIVYALSLAPLLMAVVYRWRWARIAGSALFLLALALHTLAVGLRWYVSGHWPNSNMFEAVTTAAWMGAASAPLLELWARRTAMRSVFALGAAACGAAALMAADFLPVQLNPVIGNRMPILQDVWLYIHTNVIIFSYCLIGMAAVTSALYLIGRIGGGRAVYAKAGGAASIMLTGAPGRDGRARSMLEVFDGATMVLMELSFVLLWAGIVMGAIWADHSWGRPWGWDPKEVFALNTFVVFAILIHVRLKSRDKGLWTAILAVAGAAVMIFNWTVINFVITGLHSYA